MIIFGLIYWLKQRRFPWRFALAVLAPVGFWLLFLTTYFGQPIPHTLLAKKAEYSPRIIGYTLSEWRWLCRTLPLFGCVSLLIFAVYGLRVLLGKSLIRHPLVLSLGLWILSHEIAYRLLQVPFAPWYHIHTINAIIALAVIRALECSVFLLRKSRFFEQRAQSAIILLLLAGCMLSPICVPSILYVGNQWRQPPDPRFRIYSQVGEYIDQTADANDCVAAVEIGVLGYTATRPILDLMGLVSPEVLDAKASEQLPEFVIAAAPEYIVDNSRFHRVILASILNHQEIRNNYRIVREFQTPEYRGEIVHLLKRVN